MNALMTGNDAFQIFLFIGTVLGLAWPLGYYMARVFSGKPTFVGRIVGPVERGLYRLAGVDPSREMDWKGYTAALLVFNLFAFLFLFLLLLVQGHLPLNTEKLPGTTVDLAFNTAWSFLTTTQWQSYAGESTMSYLTDMVGFTGIDFLGTATGLVVLLAFIRGVARRNAQTIGNFWCDMTRSILHVLLPLSLVLSVLLVSQGVIQNLSPYKTVPLISAIKDSSGKPVTTQTLPMGPAAAMVAIKQLGTNGGGFFNVNSAHPFENPTGFSGFLEMVAVLLIPAALCITYGAMVGSRRQGRMILAAMTILYVLAVGVMVPAEQAGNPLLAKLGVDQAAHSGLLAQSGGNMEGKEVRFGAVDSSLWVGAATGTSNGSVNAMVDSFTPIGGLVALVLMDLGEVVYGGVGTGVTGMLVFVIVAVFLAGLMVGRTPEYMGKKIEIFEMKMASLALLYMPILALLGTAVAVVSKAGLAGIGNPGAHGFSEILYAFTSVANNNGSAFGGLSANTPFYNWLLGVVLLLGRYLPIVFILAIAGSLARKKHVPASPGTLPTTTPLFLSWLLFVIAVVAALNFFPALSLGPIVEHVQMLKLAALP